MPLGHQQFLDKVWRMSQSISGEGVAGESPMARAQVVRRLAERYLRVQLASRCDEDDFTTFTFR